MVTKSIKSCNYPPGSRTSPGQSKQLNMNTRQKISFGSALASIAVTGIALSAVLGWTSLQPPWGFLLGVAAGVGVAFAIAGLFENRRSN